ncbi:MAG: hypothetical protein GY793_08465 [Proteobacteria bacterium]|nr:hypothetical protein [Pseudomonadota bacterium]
MQEGYSLKKDLDDKISDKQIELTTTARDISKLVKKQKSLQAQIESIQKNVAGLLDWQALILEEHTELMQEREQLDLKTV